ncbi:uncharacterized protein LOC110452460 [Mizuhopecten yessoensis]|uniref:Uncharacterized protein n=1 Tax=Mizuhopecten yessoensis TaxID=6573 RepID=A0A210R4T7_MIZYE|nr:uncharacterized protein LOC110452460 [Mizuhopecten yessoensis]OWF56029.1 hypothetical protein KP79_PYT00130 [Mizuhopecten yessoensis]
MDTSCASHPGTARDTVCHGCNRVICQRCVQENHACSATNQADRFEKLSTSSLAKCITVLATHVKNLVPRVDDVIKQRKPKEELFRMSKTEVSQSIDSIGVLFETATLKMKDSLQNLRRDVTGKSEHTCSQHALQLKKAMDADLARFTQLSKCPTEWSVPELLKEFETLRKNHHKYEATIPDLLLAEECNTLRLLAKEEFVTLCRSLVNCDHDSVNITSHKGIATEELKFGDKKNSIFFGSDASELENKNLVPICKIHAKSGNSWKHEMCSFSDVVLISNTVLVVDRQRLKVKRFNLQQEMIDWVRITGPYGLTILRGTDDVIVTQPNDKSLTRVSTTTGLKIVRTARVEFPYYIIKEVDETRLVASTIAAPADMISLSTDEHKSALAMNTRIHLIQHDGQLLQVLHLTDTSYERLHGTNLFPDFESFTIPSDDRIVIRLTNVEGSNFIASFTLDGKPLWLYQPPGTSRGLTSKAGLIYTFIGNAERQLTVLTSAGKAVKTARLEDYSGRGNILHAGEKGIALVDFSNTIRIFPYP